jgi:GH25 family lysozyme M1 (1,4-beta-N-acetylmuramidase)
MKVCRLALTILNLISGSVGALAEDCAIQTASPSLPYLESRNEQANFGIVPKGLVVPKEGTVVHGVDASKYQSAIDFGKIYQCGGKFAYTRIRRMRRAFVSILGRFS